MRTEIRYQCEICNRYYLSAEAARDCEAQPRKELPPIGCIFGDHAKGAFYKGITFAVASHHEEGHRQVLSKWACRPAGNDSLGHEQCGNGNNFSGYLEEGIDRNSETFKRLVAWLTGHGAEYGVERITIWQNGQAVPIEEAQ